MKIHRLLLSFAPIIPGTVKVYLHDEDNLYCNDDSLDGNLYSEFCWRHPELQYGSVNYAKGTIELAFYNIPNENQILVIVKYNNCKSYLWIPNDDFNYLSKKIKFYKFFGADNYGIYDSTENKVLYLTGLINFHSLFYDGDFNNEFLLCSTFKEIEDLVTKTSCSTRFVNANFCKDEMTLENNVDN
jgi:hypothetical protein